MNNPTAPATQNQISYICDLLDRKNLFAEPTFFDMCNAMDADELAATIQRYKDQLPRITKARASQIIDSLVKLPVKEETKRASEGGRSTPGEGGRSTFITKVPAGRYAVEGSDGTTDFYKVDKPEKGRWEGYTFVKLLIASGGHGIESLSEQNIRGAAAKTILARIEEAGIEESMKAFGHAIGSCGRCGRVLTNEESRELGIGPVCRDEMGW